MWVLFLAGLAEAARVPRLREAWSAPTLAPDVLVIPSDRGLSLAGLEVEPTTGATLVVLFDPRDGTPRWRTPPLPGVRWSRVVVGGEGIGVYGTSATTGRATVGLLDPTDGRVRWTALAEPDAELVLGAEGGVATRTPCGLTVRDPDTGEPWEEVPGRVLTVQGEGTGAGGELRSRDRICAAMPRLLGAVEHAPVVLAPEVRGDGWRLYAIAGARHPWDVPLPSTAAQPGFDWSTSTVWGTDGGSLVVHRRNLATGVEAWTSLLQTGGCAPEVRAVVGPDRLPALLVDLCDTVRLIDPHRGNETWSASSAATPVVEGEGVRLPEPLRPVTAPEVVQWWDADGTPGGQVTLQPGELATPWKDGLLVRAPGELRLHDRQGRQVWTLLEPIESWRIVDDLAVCARPGVPGRLVVDLDEGRVVGALDGAEDPLALVAAPGRNDLRLLVLQGERVRAVRVPQR